MVRASTLLALFAAIALIGSLSGAASAQGTPTSAAAIPENLEPPADSVLLFALEARGVQIYVCEADPNDATAFVWTFKAPQAELLNERGEVVGSHFAGPTWQGQDGSAVVGAVSSVPPRRMRERSPGSCSRPRITRAAALSRRSRTSNDSTPSVGSPRPKAATRLMPARRCVHPMRQPTPSSIRPWPRRPAPPRQRSKPAPSRSGCSRARRN